MVRYGRRDFVAAASAAAAMALLMPPAALAEPLTSIETGITGIRREFPAGLLEWSTDCGDDPVDYCSTLDFCESDDPMEGSYGYAFPGGECQTFNGPTILLKAGTKYKLTLRNTSTNTTTNLHTHGLHISGTGNSDDIRRRQEPGECLDYFWDIMDDHPGGTHWYHSHVHKEALKQVGGGAFGLLIVEDNYRLNPDTPQWAKYDRVLQIFSKLASGAVMTNGDIGPYVPYASFPNHYEFEVERDRWFRLRVSVIDILGLNGRLRIDPRCTMMKVAHDGIWSSTVPQLPMESYQFSAASRIDFAVKCSIPGEFPLWYNDRQAGRIIVTNALPISPKFELEEWNPRRPSFLQGIKEAWVTAANKFDVDMYVNTINELRYDEKYPLTTIAYGEVHEWTISHHHLFDEIDEHPFHMHLYHMMVVSPGGCGEMHQEGEFYDTISGLNSYTDTCVVRFKAVDVGERGLVHCHNFPHSDFGGMGWVNIAGRNMPINDEQSPAYQCAWTGMPTKSPTRGKPTPRPIAPPTSRPASSTSVPFKDYTANGCGNGGCGRCEGDCDGDGDCRAGLRCQQRMGDEAVAGCSGSARPGWDYCYDPSGGGTAPAPPPGKQQGGVGGGGGTKPTLKPTLRPTRSPTRTPAPTPTLNLPLCNMNVAVWQRPPCVEPLPPCNPLIFPSRQPPCTPFGSPPVRPDLDQFDSIQQVSKRRPGARKMLRAPQ